MKMNRSFTFLFILLMATSTSIAVHGDTAFIPGDADRISDYTNFFYNFPPDDFFYNLNDRLLFMEELDSTIQKDGLRHNLLKIITMHNSVKKGLQLLNIKETEVIGIDVADPEGYKKACAILNLMGGLGIKKTANGEYTLTHDPTKEISDYFVYINLKPTTINIQLNKTHHFYFRFKESELSIPFDYDFLRRITGLPINSSSFFKTMVENKRFSLLLGIIYRLSDKEINHISGLLKSPKYGAWKQIYENKKFLMGLFLLSDALRVNEKNLWVLPGGKKAETFWSKLTGADYKKSPLEFLHNLACKDEGKLNYLFIFSSFLQPEIQKALFTGTNAKKMEAVYSLISLSGKEKLNKSRFPRLKDFNFYTLLYSLRMQDNRFYIPPGTKCWLKVIKSPDIPEEGGSDLFDLLFELLKRSKNDKKFLSEIQRFMSINTKFHHRPHMMTEEILFLMYHNYEKYNVLIDFIEKIPITKPGTVITMFNLVEKIEKLNKKEKKLFRCFYQSLFELLSHESKYAPKRYDYDALIGKLVDIPLTSINFYDQIFNFFETGLKVKSNGKSLIDFVLGGIDNRMVNINRTNYKYVIKDICRKNIKDILHSQRMCSLSILLKINRLFDQLIKERKNLPAAKTICRGITEKFRQLSYAEISKDAPKHIQDRVISYNKSRLNKDLKSLVQNINSKTTKGDLESIIEKIKKNYLLHELNAYILAMAYALNAKIPKLKIFLNPNLVRLHDFDTYKKRTPWNYCGKSGNPDSFSKYHFSGGLSRLNIAFASKWQEHLFRRNIIHNSAQILPVIINLFDFYPTPAVSQSVTYNGLLVDFGLELIYKARDNEAVRRDLIKEMGTITAGYHYRKAVEYLTGKTGEHLLFFKEIMQLGESFLKKGKYIAESAYKKQLLIFARRIPGSGKKSQDHGFGNIYYHTFGNLKPQQFKIFPQDVSTFFDPGWISGEMIDEFKIKLSWHLYRKKIPPFLLGQVIYTYFNKNAPRLFCQNHDRDYFSTFFIFQVFNNSHLKRIIKKLQKDGYLKLN